MASMDYRIEKGQLVIRELPSGNIVRIGSFEVPVLQILPLANGCLVLLDPSATKKPTFENLLMVGADGAVRSRAQLPDSHDAFVRVVERDSGVEAQTWNGQLVEIDLATGRTGNARFVK